MLCDLEAWRVTQVPRPPRHRSPGQPPGGPDGDEGDLLAGQRAAALGAAYHGGSGPVGFAWVVLAEPAGRAELEELTFGVFTAQGAAQRFDNPQAQLSVRRWQDRHAELRLAASTGLWRIRVLAGAATSPEAAEVAGLL